MKSAAFDGRLPLAVQIDRLGDAQIRALARGLDPIAIRWTMLIFT